MNRITARLTQAALLLAASIATVQPAAAGPYTVSQQETGSPFGTPKWSERASVNLNGKSMQVNAGMFRLHMDDGAGDAFDLDAFCIELDKFLNLPGPYTAQSYTSTNAGAVNALWSNAFGLVDGTQTAAAFQFSLWEITHDTGLDLSSGNLVIDGADATDSLAQSWLTNIDTGSWTPSKSLELTAWQSESSQDQLSGKFDEPSPEAVPVPAAGAMLLGVIVAGGIAARRRRAA